MDARSISLLLPSPRPRNSLRSRFATNVRSKRAEPLTSFFESPDAFHLAPNFVFLSRYRSLQFPFFFFSFSRLDRKCIERGQNFSPRDVKPSFFFHLWIYFSNILVSGYISRRASPLQRKLFTERGCRALDFSDVASSSCFSRTGSHREIADGSYVRI